MSARFPYKIPRQPPATVLAGLIPVTSSKKADHSSRMKVGERVSAEEGLRGSMWMPWMYSTRLPKYVMWWALFSKSWGWNERVRCLLRFVQMEGIRGDKGRWEKCAGMRWKDLRFR